MADPSNRRRITLADTMILVGATAACIAIDRALIFGLAGPWIFPETLAHANAWDYQASAVGLSFPCLGVLSLSLVVIRLIPPRKRRQRLFRQPGFIATGVGSLFFVPTFGTMMYFKMTRSVSVLAVFRTLLLGPLIVGAAVAGTWITLRVTGRRRPAQDWVDGLGIGVGWLWIASTIMAFYLMGLIGW